MRTRQQVRDDAMQLSEQDRLRLAEELVGSAPPDAEWWQRWTAEAHVRYERLASGEDAGLSVEECWAVVAVESR